MMSSLLLILLFSLVAHLVDGTYVKIDEWEWAKSPLPVFTRVVTERLTHNATSISAHYSADERPHAQWFVDGVPFVGGMGDYFLLNFYEGYMYSVTSIIVNEEVGTRFAVCIQTSKAMSCLQFHPVYNQVMHQEYVEFPWPLIVPAPVARYHKGSKTYIFAYELETPHDYAYSGRFIFRTPGQGNQSQPLRQSVSHGMGGSQAGDIFTMAPVTSGSPGWMMEVATDREEYEGVLVFQTTFTPSDVSDIVEKCVTIRPISIYRRPLNSDKEPHTAPFPHNFVAMVPHRGSARRTTCRTQGRLFCLISCPFLMNGDVHGTRLNLARVHPNGTVENLVLTSLAGRVWQLGSYVAEARFLLNTFGDTDAGTYQCSVTLAGNTATTQVIVTAV